MKKFLVSSLFAIFYFLFANGVFADTTCTPIYGGGQTCATTGNIGISKTVQNPQTGGFVANLGINDPRYSQEQTITFNVTVTNNDSKASTITVKDTLPQYVKFISGPGGFDSNTQTLTWQVTNLKVGESQTFTIQGKITNSSNIPSGNICAVNQVNATSNNNDNASANSQFCIANPVPTVAPPAKVTVTPPTGPEVLPLLTLIPGALAGLGFLKLSKKS